MSFRAQLADRSAEAQVMAILFGSQTATKGMFFPNGAPGWDNHGPYASPPAAPRIVTVRLWVIM